LIATFSNHMVDYSTMQDLYTLMLFSKWSTNIQFNFARSAADRQLMKKLLLILVSWWWIELFWVK